MNIESAHFIFKLRHNISLEGDVMLAEMELKAFLKRINSERKGNGFSWR